MANFSLIISLSFLLIATSCYATDSNLDDFTYPAHECGNKIQKPKKPARVTSYKDIDDYNAAVIKYNLNVSDYNETIKTYKSCINQYIQNGNHDINIIRKELNNELKEARTK